MVLQLILWLATAIFSGSHINGCLNDTWHGHHAVIRVTHNGGVVTTPRTHHNKCHWH